MGDEKEDITEMKIKEHGPSSIIFLMLNSSNYTVWAMRMKIAFKVNKVWEAIDPGSKAEGKNDMAIALIFQSIPEALTLQVGDLDTAKAVWDAIKTRHVGAERVREARLQTLMAEFDRLKMKEEDTIDAFVGKLAEISSKSASLGEIIEEPKIVKKFLKSLPRRRYIHIVASLEQVLDLKTTSFEDIVGRLKAYEERIGEEEEELQDDKTKLLYSNTESQQDGYGGRGAADEEVDITHGEAEVVGDTATSNNNVKLIDKELNGTFHTLRASSAISLDTTQATVRTSYSSFKKLLRRKMMILKKLMS